VFAGNHRWHFVPDGIRNGNPFSELFLLFAGVALDFGRKMWIDYRGTFKLTGVGVRRTGGLAMTDRHQERR
jgi:hypothetical protein